MSKDLPPTFDEFGEEAQFDFLKEARTTNDILAYLYALMGEEYDRNGAGRPSKEVLARLYVHLRNDDQIPTEDSM